MARMRTEQQAVRRQAMGWSDCGDHRVLTGLRSGWTVVALICLTVLLLWLPDLDLPLGNSDDGRILGRFGLQARNFWELGAIESRFGAIVDPFIRAEYDVAPRTEPPIAAVTYAHHPPLQVLITVISVGLLGDNLPALRIIPFLMGSATIAFMASLLRVRGISWGPTLLAVAVMSSTGFFYVYARVGVGYSLLVASTAAVAWLRETEQPPRSAVIGMCVLAMFTAMQSWIAMATLVLLVPWLFAGTRRRARGARSACTGDTLDTAASAGLQSAAAPSPSGFMARTRICLSSGWSPALGALMVGAAVGVTITAVWLLNATGIDELSERVAFRVGSDVNTVSQQTTFTFGEFLSRQWRFASHELMAPPWFRALLLPALIAGVSDRRTRTPMLITLAFAATMTFGFQQGAWIHRLWNFPWLAPITLGTAALADAVRRLLSGRAVRLRLPAAMLAGLVPAVTLFLVVTGGTRNFYLANPADAGAVLEERVRVETKFTWMTSGPGAPERTSVGFGDVGAKVMWVTPGIPTPRWVSYYMGTPVFTLDEKRLGEVDGSDLVLTRTNRVPEYFPEEALDHPIVARGVYRLIRADRLIG